MVVAPEPRCPRRSSDMEIAASRAEMTRNLRSVLKFMLAVICTFVSLDQEKPVG